MILKIILKKLRNFAEFIGALIMPRACLICNRIIGSGHFCADDFNQLRFITTPSCKICDQPFDFAVDLEMVCAACLTKQPRYDQAFSVFAYDEISKKFIFAFKYQDQTNLAPFLAKLMLNKAHQIITDIDVITPIALHKKRLKGRRYNHSAILAKELAKISKKLVIHDLLIRHKNTKPQAGLSKSGRKRNIEGAFKFNEKYLKRNHNIAGKNILIIDDVITTGATIDNCCRILRKQKVGKIFVLTLAKTILH